MKIKYIACIVSVIASHAVMAMELTPKEKFALIQAERFAKAAAAAASTTTTTTTTTASSSSSVTPPEKPAKPAKPVKPAKPSSSSAASAPTITNKPEGQSSGEIEKIEEIRDKNEQDELFDEISHRIHDEAVSISRDLVLGNKSGRIHELLRPRIEALRDEIKQNASRVATSNRAKIIDSRNKIALLCYVYQMFLDIDQGFPQYTPQEKKKKKEEIWSIVVSAGLNYPLPNNDIQGTSMILQHALVLPMYQEIAPVSSIRQVTSKRELEEVIRAVAVVLQKGYNEAGKANDDPCSEYDYLMAKFDRLEEYVQNAIRYGVSQTEYKIGILITFWFLYLEIDSSGCFKGKSSEREAAKDALWQRLKGVMPAIQGERPNIPGPKWVLNILRQRSDPVTRAFANPIFVKKS